VRELSLVCETDEDGISPRAAQTEVLLSTSRHWPDVTPRKQCDFLPNLQRPRKTTHLLHQPLHWGRHPGALPTRHHHDNGAIFFGGILRELSPLADFKLITSSAPASQSTAGSAPCTARLMEQNARRISRSRSKRGPRNPSVRRCSTNSLHDIDIQESGPSKTVIRQIFAR